MQWLDLGAPAGCALARDLAGLVRLAGRPGSGIPAGRLARLSLPGAGALVQAAEAESAAQRTASRLDRQTLLAFPDGYRILILEDRLDFEREGQAMRHCAAGYWRKRGPGRELLSLRAPSGRPCVTFEVVNGKEVHQITGRANLPVASRYRPYVRQFLRDFDLEIRGDGAWAGFTTRSFDVTDPESWWAQPWLPSAFYLDGVDRPLGGPWPYLRFLDEFEGSVDELAPTALDRLAALCRGPAGDFAWFAVDRRLRLYGLEVRLVSLGYAWRILYCLENAGDAATRRLRQAIRQRVEAALYRFCQSHPGALVRAGSCPGSLSLEMAGLSHRRRSDLCRRIARHRRAFRKSRGLHVADSQVEAWEANRRSLLEILERRPGAYY